MYKSALGVSGFIPHAADENSLPGEGEDGWDANVVKLLFASGELHQLEMTGTCLPVLKTEGWDVACRVGVNIDE